MTRPLPHTTNAAEGMPRRSFTVAELERMVEAGILPEDERIELIGGEVAPMSPQGNWRELLKAALNDYWVRRTPDELRLVPDDISAHRRHLLKPDFTFYRKASGIQGLSPAAAPLVVEVSDSSLGYDLGRKAGLYAGFAIAELSVIDARGMRTHVHREPLREGYRTIAVFEADQLVEPQASPALAVTLADLDLR